MNAAEPGVGGSRSGEGRAIGLLPLLGQPMAMHLPALPAWLGLLCL